MSKTVINIDLSSKSIKEALKKINDYKTEFLKKTDTYRKRIAEEIAVNASEIFNNSLMDDAVIGNARNADVTVSVKDVNVTDKGNISVVCAIGKDAVWVEFGAGVYHNGSVGSKPNPFAENTDFAIGTYGEGKGKQKAWGYYDENGELVVTHGTPATMPMYNSAQGVLKKSVAIAREVFG